MEGVSLDPSPFNEQTLIAGESPAHFAVASGTMDKPQAKPRSQPVILAVDDDPAILRIIESQLTRHEFVVRTASSGEDALRILKELTPAVLILDVMMEGISGYDVCHVVKLDKRLQGVPVIFLTSRGTPQDYKTGHDLGAVVYMTKPLKVEKLLNMVQMLAPVSA
jgi:DNA-binding response OmpR family regulator